LKRRAEFPHRKHLEKSPGSFIEKSVSEPEAVQDEPIRDSAGERLDCKIVTLTHYLPPYIARVLYYTSQQVRDLRVLLSIEQEPNRLFGNTWDGLAVSVQKSFMLRRPWKHDAGFSDELYLHFPYDTISQLRRNNPDIVFSFELGFRSLTSALYCKLHRKKLILCVCVSEHTEKGRGIARNLLRRVLLRAADAITFNGPSCRNYLKKFGTAEKKLFHFPYACSDLFRYEGPIARTQVANRRLLCIGQLTERKGVLPMLQSLKQYCESRPDQNVEIDFVGNGILEQALRDVALPSNLHMRLLGHLEYREISRVMEQSGILVFPTLADEWGLVVNEAMQAGMPVIGSIYGQASTTLIREGKNGWLYCPDKADELAQKLDCMFSLEDPKLLAMRVAAGETVQDITPMNVATSAVEMFKHVLGK
jgi:glycosyltransferase involved in cell wall biosynthesis